MIRNQKLYFINISTYLILCIILKMEINLIQEKKDSDNALLKKYLVDIRNLRKLDTEMIQNIPNMSNEDIINIIIAYNDVVEFFCKFVEYLK